MAATLKSEKTSRGTNRRIVIRIKRLRHYQKGFHDPGLQSTSSQPERITSGPSCLEIAVIATGSAVQRLQILIVINRMFLQLITINHIDMHKIHKYIYEYMIHKQITKYITLVISNRNMYIVSILF